MDDVSVRLEKWYSQWLSSNKLEDLRMWLVNQGSIIDFGSMKLFDVADVKNNTPVKRGKAGERTLRPSNEKYGNSYSFYFVYFILNLLFLETILI